MKFLYSTIILFLIFTFSFCSTTYAQKIYVPTAEKYVKMDYKDDVRSDLTEYNASYVHVYPGFDENDQYEGKPYIFTLTITSNKTGSVLTASHFRQYAVDDPIKSVPLGNPSIVGSAFYSDEMSGKFVILTYTNKGKEISVRGFFRKHKTGSGYDFYERQ